ncbi:histidine phosphatase superfamily [Lipomyces japonicus]|uniref:histidine phosphatase superfamily n=1 Tax=Lipomyces japonicus TaxID=56871 RepID=UPI0034CE5181
MTRSKKSSRWHLFDHLGGNSPWIPYRDSLSPQPLPQSCVVDQVHMLARHAARYPTLAAGIKMHDLMTKLHANTTVMAAFADAFPFITQWRLFFDMHNKTDDSNSGHAQLEKLTTTGVFSGTMQALNAGVEFRKRYGHLVGQHGNNATASTVFSCSCPRVMHTAETFAAGFFNHVDDDDIAIRHVVVPDKAPSRGADTLTPGKMCANYRTDSQHGRPRAYARFASFKTAYLSRTVRRIARVMAGGNNSSSSGHIFTTDELFTMQEMCGFEMLARGVSDRPRDHSPWCAVFTRREWEEFEYARDLLHYYRSGPGCKYSHPLGFLYLNATSHLISQGPEKAGSYFFSFAHDGDIVPLLSTLGVLPEPSSMSSRHANLDRTWKTSRIVPMGGRVVFERVSCHDHADHRQIGIRLILNDGLVSFPGCEDYEFAIGGSSSSSTKICPMHVFMDLVGQKVDEVGGNVDELCGLPPSVHGFRPSFWTEHLQGPPGKVYV